MPLPLRTAGLEYRLRRALKYRRQSASIDVEFFDSSGDCRSNHRESAESQRERLAQAPVQLRAQTGAWSIL